MVTASAPIFGQAIADMNAAVASMLANVLVTIGGAVDLPCRFIDPAHANALGDSGIYATQPQLILATVDVPAGASGTAVLVNGVNYTIASIPPGVEGLSTLLLELA